MRIPPLALFLALSVAANAALIGYVTLQPSAHRTRTPAAGRPATKNASARAAAREKLPAAEALTAAVSADLPAYTENLRKAGVSDRIVRAIINAEINDRFRQREEALRPPRRKYQYWENQHNYYEDDGVTLEQRLALLDLRREKAALRNELLGDAPGSDKQDDDPVPLAKRTAAKEISEDYGAMIEQIRRETRGFMLPSDEEKVKYLEAERRRELAEVLGPEELREYELRTSQTTQQMRWDLTAFGPAEEEFRAIHELRSVFDREFPHRNNAGPEYWEQRNKAEEAMNGQLKVVLGEDRYKDYERAQDWEYRQLRQLTNRLGLEPTAATQIYDLRDNTAQTARQIIDAKDMDLASKREALQLLAGQTREQIVSQLGEEGAHVFLRTHDNWLDGLGNGRVRYKTGPRSYSYKTLPPETKESPGKTPAKAN